jgi:replicative DNA helicase
MTIAKTPARRIDQSALSSEDRRRGSSEPLPVAGRTLPHSDEAEAGLLACCLLDDSDVVARCQEQKLTAEAFYNPTHRLIFESICRIYDDKSSVDLILVCEDLKDRDQLEEIGGAAFVSELTNRIETTAHAVHFIEIVREKYLLRRLIRTATQTVEKCFNFAHEGLETFIEEIEQEIFRISEDRFSESAQPISESVGQAVKIIHRLIERKGELSGLTSGFTDLDKLTFGFHPQEMIILAARPSMGKTSLALNVAEATVLPKKERDKPVPTLFFSLEMSAEQLAMRLLCSRARVSAVRMRESFLNREEMERLAAAALEIKQAPLWIDDSGHLTIVELRAKARRLHARRNLGLIVIDYLQLVSGLDSRVQREQQIAEISRGLKAMAKELGLPIIVLSQLNRESEKEKRQPRLSDLRESGSIEQDADVVLLLARPRDTKDDFSVVTDRADLIVAKQRNGPVGDIRLTFLREITRFENYTE